MTTKQGTTQARTTSFSRNSELEKLLKDINSALWTAEEKILGNYPALRFPLLLVMGPIRSGTTLFMQWMANTGVVAYPTNLLARFYRAPILGAKIQLMLTDSRYSFRDELIELARVVEYQSENGKTRGVLAPNEFWYFWRRFLSEHDRDVWMDRELAAAMDVQTMKAELAGIMDVFNMPFILKGMLFNYNIRYLDTIFDKVIFIRMERDPASNIESILDARRRQFGTAEAWYSFGIPEYEELKMLEPAEQAAGQVYYINRAIDEGLRGVADSRKLTVRYEEFCDDPRLVYEMLVSKLAENGCPVSPGYRSEKRFRVARTGVNDPAVLSACRKFYD